jgi:hypothetical protein
MLHEAEYKKWFLSLLFLLSSLLLLRPPKMCSNETGMLCVLFENQKSENSLCEQCRALCEKRLRILMVKRRFGSLKIELMGNSICSREKSKPKSTTRCFTGFLLHFYVGFYVSFIRLFIVILRVFIAI